MKPFNNSHENFQGRETSQSNELAGWVRSANWNSHVGINLKKGADCHLPVLKTEDSVSRSLFILNKSNNDYKAL